MPVKIFVVSLERAIERRKFIASQLRKLSLNYEFIQAL